MGHPDDEVLQSALAECLAAFASKGAEGLDAVLTEYPEHADVLRARMDELVRLGLASNPTEDDTTSPFSPPEVLGDFVRGRRLGGGGMGVVFEARQRSLGRQVALKMIRPDRLHLDTARQRFRTEVETIARLKHPAIVPVYSVGEEQGFPYFVMELVDGKTLEQAIHSLSAEPASKLSGADLYRVLGSYEKDHGADKGDADSGDADTGDADSGEEESTDLPAIFAGSWEETCIRVMTEVAQGLRYAHENGVLHRDLKPSNILLTPGGRVLLFDFGLTVTSRSARITQDDAIVGSPPYMAPELLGQESGSVASEVYALGVTLYEMLALELPFLGRSVSELQEQIHRGEIVPLRHRNRNVSWEIETVCLAAMDRDPGRRYRSVAEFTADLGRVLRHEPIHARPPGPLLRVRRWCQRRPTAAVATVLGTILLVGGPTALWLQQRSANVVIAAEKDRADDNLDTALNAVGYFVLEMGSEQLQSTPHMDAFSRPFLEKAIVFYQSLLASDSQSADARTGKRLAETQRRLAWLHKKLGHHEQAVHAAREAVRIARIRSESNDPDARGLLGRSLLILGRMVRDDKTEDPLSMMREAIECGEFCLAHGQDRGQARHVIVEAHRFSAWLHADRADFDAAESAHEAALRHIQELAKERKQKDADMRAVASACRRDLAVLLDKRGQSRRAQQLLERVRTDLTSLIADNPNVPSHQLELADCLETLAGYHMGTQPKMAVDLQTEAIERLRRLTSNYPSVLDYRRKLAVSLDSMGEWQQNLGVPTAELKYLLEARKHFDWLHQQGFDGGVRFLFESAANLHSLSLFEFRRDDFAKAADWAGKAIALIEPVMQGAPGRAQHRYQLSKYYGALALAKSQVHENDAAGRAFRQALEIQRDLTRRVPDQQYYQKALAQTLNNFGAMQGSTGDITGAIESFSEAVRLYRARAESKPKDTDRQHALAGGLYNLAHFRLRQNNRQAAMPLLREAYACSLRAVRGNPRRLSYARRLENTLMELGMIAARAGEFKELEKHAAAIVESNPRRHSGWLQAASLLAMALPICKEPDARRSIETTAMSYLRELVKRGQHSPRVLARNPALKNLEGAAGYATTMTRLNR